MQVTPPVVNQPISERRNKKAIAHWSLAAALLCFVSLTNSTSIAGQAKREKVSGVANFGRVTDKYFRGGEVTPEGVKNLASLGVRTIIDLREEADEKEAAACKEHGITYYSFPMTTDDTPAPGQVEKVAEIILKATEPVYVHCSGGKHRTGTVCAYIRQKHHGHSAEKAWQEQQSYGFGTPEEHANLFLFIYGNTSLANKLIAHPAQSASSPAAKAETSESKSPSTAPAAAKSTPAADIRRDLKPVNLTHPNGHLSATATYISTTAARAHYHLVKWRADL